MDRHASRGANVVILSDSGQLDGGSSKVAVTSAVELSKRGHRVALFSGTAPDASLIAAGVQVVSAGGSRLSKETSVSKRFSMVVGNSIAADRFAELIDGFDPAETVVHVHTYASLLSGATLQVAFDRGFATALTCHDYMVACPNGAYYQFPSQQICRLQPLSLSCIACDCTTDGSLGKSARVLRQFIDSHMRRTVDRFDRIAFVSDFSRRVIEKTVDIGNRGRLVYNPCDVVRSRRAPVTASRTVLWLGRLVPEKDPVLLARAAKVAGVPVVFCGDGPLRDEVIAANRDAEVTGWIESGDVQTRRKSARALAMTSRWYEAAPLVVPEALAAGLPVLVPDTCAAQEFIVANETGLIYRSGDVEDLARALVQISDDAFADRLARQAYERYWADPLTMDRHISELETLYSEMLSR